MYSNPAHLSASVGRRRHSPTPFLRRIARDVSAVVLIACALAACSADTQTTSVPPPVVSGSATPNDSASPVSAPGPALAEPAVVAGPAAVRLNEPGPQNAAIARRVGIWNVTETVWDHPGAAPVTTTGLVAERLVMGSLLQEVIRPPEDSAPADVKRTDLLTFNRVESRWDYVSFDTRAPVGLMPAWSQAAGDGATIDLEFAPFAVTGPGTEVTGQMLRMEQTISYPSPDHDVKDQYFTVADGTGTRWLAHRYDYTRRA